MFSYRFYSLVREIQKVPEAYRPDPSNDGYDCWDNNVGSCPSWFYGICRYEEQGQLIPCIGCTYTH